MTVKLVRLQWKKVPALLYSNLKDAIKDIPTETLHTERNLGALMYLYQGTRPDISFVIITLSRFNTSYKHELWHAAKRVLKYLKGSTDYKIKYGPTFKDIVGYSDASFPKANR